jgi:hypothetical protein
MATRLGASNAQVVINHGSAGVYEQLIRRARAQGVRASFSAVNSGSAQLVSRLGDLAHGMVFAQVVPSPWERKSAITREYQEEFRRQKPGQEFSYGRTRRGFGLHRSQASADPSCAWSPTRRGPFAPEDNSQERSHPACCARQHRENI